MATMTIDEYKDVIMTKLGAPLMDIEIEMDGNEVLDKVINAAFLELRNYIDTPYFQTFTATNGAIDVSEYNVKAILYVMRGEINYRNVTNDTSALLWSPLTSFYTQSANMGYSLYSQLNYLQDYMSTLYYRQMRNTLNQDCDYQYDAVNQKLYIFQQYPTSSTITMVYNKYYNSAEEIIEPYWQQLMIRLATAYAKEVLGRIRGKYTPTSSPYSLDADTLLSEAQAELTEIRTFLQDNDNLFLPID